ncbi:hypothetical protein M422DRAFT_276611 [Sphaerobolus stellatus SS14]|uniref:Uncharacterized protein n=1 Tax=Sphaerobolus stellatus (strain SS14) TaxID=990650 RepID=A0A0C9T2D1_SPHS4|nr:hypothetical protein M422DRAFT_276611 [Sphaerobolus stellatus SS14]
MPPSTRDSATELTSGFSTNWTMETVQSKQIPHVEEVRKVLSVEILQWIFVFAISPINNKVFYEEGHKDPLDEGEPHPDGSISVESLKRVKRFIWAYSRSSTPNILQLQILNRLHNMKRFQFVLQTPTIPAGRLQPSPGASLETLCLKVANSANKAQFIVKFPFPSLRRFILQYISNTRFEYQPPTFSFDEICNALDKIEREE